MSFQSTDPYRFCWSQGIKVVVGVLIHFRIKQLLLKDQVGNSTHGAENNPGRGLRMSRPVFRAYLSLRLASSSHILPPLSCGLRHVGLGAKFPPRIILFFRRTGNDRDFVSVALQRRPPAPRGRRERPSSVRPAPVAARLCTHPWGNSFVLAERRGMKSRSVR